MIETEQSAVDEVAIRALPLAAAGLACARYLCALPTVDALCRIAFAERAEWGTLKVEACQEEPGRKRSLVGHAEGWWITPRDAEVQGRPTHTFGGVSWDRLAASAEWGFAELWRELGPDDAIQLVRNMALQQLRVRGWLGRGA